MSIVIMYRWLELGLVYIRYYNIIPDTRHIGKCRKHYFLRSKVLTYINTWIYDKLRRRMCCSIQFSSTRWKWLEKISMFITFWSKDVIRGANQKLFFVVKINGSYALREYFVGKSNQNQRLKKKKSGYCCK